MCLATAGQLISRHSLSQLLSCRVNWSYLKGPRQRRQAVKLGEIRKDGGSPLDLRHTLAFGWTSHFIQPHLHEPWLEEKPDKCEWVNSIFPSLSIHLSSCYLFPSLLPSSPFSHSFSLANPFFHPLLTSSLLVSPVFSLTLSLSVVREEFCTEI